ncbi:MAG: hypothetical protein QXO84_02930 [Candidatus Aenigmatarchaeota archaeon]
MSKTISWLMVGLALFLALISLVNLIEKIIFRNCNGFSEIILESKEIDVKLGEGKLVKGFLTNKGVEDEFKIQSDFEWIVTKPEKLRLKENETGEIFVYVSPIKKGEFLTNIKASSYCKTANENLLIRVS